MIFATTGTQLPFDRFLEMLDSIAPSLGGEELVVQAIPDRYRPRNLTTRGFITPDEFGEIFSRARLIVAHAGMGTIISALESAKPIIVVPRKAALGEHRNDHQQATARRLGELGYVHVADSADTLASHITDPSLAPMRAISPTASSTLVSAILAG